MLLASRVQKASNILSMNSSWGVVALIRLAILGVGFKLVVVDRAVAESGSRAAVILYSGSSHGQTRDARVKTPETPCRLESC